MNTRNTQSPTCSQFAAELAPSVEERTSGKGPPTHLTSGYPEEFSSKQKVILSREIGASSLQSNSSTHQSISGFSSPLTTGVQNSTSKGIASGQRSTDLFSPSAKESPSLGLSTNDKERKQLQLWTFLMEYFPDTFLAVANVAIAGNLQHNPGESLHWAREKSTDQMNTAFRHQWDYGRGVIKDTDGQYHLAKAIWRLSAQLQLDIEKERAT